MFEVPSKPATQRNPMTVCCVYLLRFDKRDRLSEVAKMSDAPYEAGYGDT